MNFSNKAVCISFVFIQILSLSTFMERQTIWGFDEAKNINPSYFEQENFLDIKSYQFSKLLEDEWFEKGEGWRLSGGSLGMELLYTYFEARLPHQMNDEILLLFQAKQEEFYEVKPFRYLVEVEWRPIEWAALSFLGMPEYDKRNADEGSSFTLGKRPWNFIRFQQLEQNLFHNEKNLYDESYYSPHPLENILEGSVQWKKWRARFHFLTDKPLKQVFPKEGITFKHEGWDHQAVLDYQFDHRALAGVTWRQFEFEKSRTLNSTSTSSSPDNRSQKLLYETTDLYWLLPLSQALHATFGFRQDRFKNRFRQLDNPTESHDFQLWTRQMYGILRHQTQPDDAWEYGLYAGDTEKSRDYLVTSKEDELKESIEVKLRVSWTIINFDDHATLMMTTTWNMDDFFNNFWDGGNMLYQRTF